MIPALTSIHLQSLGLSEKAAECSVKLNENMKQYVRTTAGISKQYYSRNDMYEIFGEGQGKGSSLPNWIFTMSPLLNVLEDCCTGVLMISTCWKYTSKQVADSYVDGTDSVVVDQTTQSTDTPKNITEKLCLVAQNWSDLLLGS
eukprot:4184044-Ditylum_brightwellii.AAC.1